ncbi:MAG: hypothetical protein LBN93_05810 [Candidatus Symbiothrix sp.]|jgi:hypothetical protein|nr:hypothetical protein [Candidatus Symbiothrix sp.]
MKTKNLVRGFRTRFAIPLWVATLLVIGNASLMTAQVVIGSTTQEANAGAILDLSKKDDGLNTALGLLLPSISLSSDDMNLVTLGTDSAAGVDEKNVEGLLIYCPGPDTSNPSDPTLPKGLYVWNGTAWQGVILA